ncbi:hypothetical protein [Lentzea sp. NBRC 105346]|uniref:hypothetical protein n=1 Tax=Lentzea sp. NBRC 105346 TaxID=3032205 RepID=UPI002557231C|nr:hypothetical protein [Lentzea sp. NBRC 105346]
MRIRVTRDSVAMGDDVYAPHEEFLDLPDDATIADALHVVLSRPYLAQIQGGQATWLANSDAVVAQQWPEPRWVTSPSSPAPAALHFRYLQQRDPEEVHAELTKTS